MSERGEGEEDEQDEEPPEAIVGVLPQEAGDDERHDEVRHVDDERGVVPHVRDARRVQRVLQRDGRHRAAEEPLVDADLRERVRHQPGAGRAAQHVVQRQQHVERQPVDDHLLPMRPELRRCTGRHQPESHDREDLRARTGEPDQHHERGHADRPQEQPSEAPGEPRHHRCRGAGPFADDCCAHRDRAASSRQVWRPGSVPAPVPRSRYTYPTQSQSQS